MLARSAMTPDHLPASQSIFLSRLIEVKSSAQISAPVAAPSGPAQPSIQQFMPEMIDFEAFGQSLEGDQSKTQWPPAPLPFNFDLSSFTTAADDNGPMASGSGMQSSNHGMMHNTAPNQGMANAPTTASSGTNTLSNLPTDLDGWVAATQFPMPGLSLGMGSNFGQVST